MANNEQQEEDEMRDGRRVRTGARHVSLCLCLVSGSQELKCLFADGIKSAIWGVHLMPGKKREERSSLGTREKAEGTPTTTTAAVDGDSDSR